MKEVVTSLRLIHVLQVKEEEEKMYLVLLPS